MEVTEVMVDFFQMPLLKKKRKKELETRHWEKQKRLNKCRNNLKINVFNETRKKE